MHAEGVPGRRGVRGLAALLLSAAVLAAPAAYGDDTRPQTVDGLVAALRVDPVVVDQTMGDGDAAGAHDLLTSQVRKVGFPVYVALVSRPVDDPTSDSDRAALITALHRKLDRPGLYVVATTDHADDVEGFGIPADPTLVDVARFSATDQLQKLLPKDDYPGPVAQAQLAVLTAQHADRMRPARDYGVPSVVPRAELRRIAGSRYGQPTPDVDNHHAYSNRADIADRWLAGGAGFGFVAPLVLLLLRGRWPGWAPSQRLPKRPTSRGVPAAPDRVRPAEVRALARREVDRLAGAIAGADVRRARPEWWDRADRAREAAEKVQASDDLADQVGAVVLARTGRRDLARAIGRRRDTRQDRPYHCCFFNPLHDEGVQQATWRQGDSELRIPVCHACRAVEDGGAPNALKIGRKPYYERDDLWARTGYGALVDDLADVVLREWRP